MSFSALNRPLARLAICSALAVTLAVAALVFVATLPGSATTAPRAEAADTSLGIDVTTSGNDASTLGTIDTCKEIGVGKYDALQASLRQRPV